MTPFTTTERFACTAEEAFEFMLDTDFLGWLLENSGGTDCEVAAEETPDGWEVTLDRTLPADIPSFARALVGDHLTVRERRTWGEADADGVRTGQFAATVDGAPVQVTGSLRLADDGEGGSELSVDGSVSARVPLVGGKVEALVRDQLLRFTAREEELAEIWLEDD